MRCQIRNERTLCGGGRKIKRECLRICSRIVDGALMRKEAVGKVGFVDVEREEEDEEESS